MYISAERIQLREQAIVLRKIGWTQQAIADHIGVPRRTISDWLSHNMKGTFLTFPKFKVGDKVLVNGRCPKYILKQIRHNRVRTVVGVFYDSERGHCSYTLGTNKWDKSMDRGWVHFFRSDALHKPVEGRGLGRPRKKRRYNLRMKCTVTPSNQNLTEYRVGATDSTHLTVEVRVKGVKMKLEKKYQVLPDMNEEQFQALKADIAERGVLTPIDVDENGTILDGHHRYRACVELGIPDFPTIIRLELSEAEKRMFARKSNMLRRHLTQNQMREIIASQLHDTPNWANNRVAQELGVDSKTVAVVRERLEATSEIPKLDRLVGADGKERPVKQQTRKTSIMAANEAEYNEYLAKIARQIAQITGQGFLSARQGITVIQSPPWDPLEQYAEGDRKEWLVYLLHEFLQGRGGDEQSICGCDINWFFRHADWFKNPTHVMEEFPTYIDGFKRKPPSKRMLNQRAKMLAEWEEFRDQKRECGIEDIEKELEAAITSANKGPLETKREVYA